MAVAGQVGSAYWPGCSPAREKYVASFRSLISAMSMGKQGARAKHLGIPLSTLSNYWTGRRVPSAVTLGAIYDAVRRSAAAVPDQLEHLERLRKSAARRNARPVPPWESGDICAAERMAAATLSAPSAQPESGTCSPSGADPARRPALDRHSRENGKAGETARALRAAQSAGDRRGVIGIAWSASKSLTHGELSLAAADLYASGHSALGEALLLGGRERGHEETMRLAITLIRTGLSVQADLVLRAALPRGGGGQP
ncbi:hypothetical protein AB0M92_10170 [Streptomyces sp. NPDC051582]|uniref:hypothetical protein n=1 Tax=Streptomyces sp. NPDC051582 TaxID=3155167 RepID=UPI00342FBF67